MAIQKVDILAIGAHPDDVELSCSGTLLKAGAAGKKFGIMDMTEGELGTRGSAELRLQEAEASRKILGAEFRINLGLRDGFFQNDEETQKRIIEVIRACRPDVVLCNALRDRHPDHGKGALVQKTAAFLSGLRRIETKFDGDLQEAWRPRLVMHYLQDFMAEPDIVIDVTEHWATRMESIKAFSSQFYDPNSKEPSSAISSKDFMDTIEGKGKIYGRYIGAAYGEGYQVERPVGASLVTDII